MRKYQIKRAPVVSSSLALLSVYFNLAIDCELSLMRETKERKNAKTKKAKTYPRFPRLACPPITCDIQVTSNYLSLQNTIVHAWTMEQSRQKYIHWFKIKTFDF